MGGRRCKKCGQRTGPDRRLCKMCSLDKRYGNDFESAADVDDEPDELEYRCVECGHEQVGTLSDNCEECGARRWRYIGPLPGEDESDHEERVATDGGTKELIPARVDYDDLIGADCPVCGKEMMPGAIRFNGSAWEHKSDEAHPQAGHHRISELLDEDEEQELRADGGRPAGSTETRLGEVRKQLRIVLDDVEFEDEDTAEYVEAALACAESAAVCLEGEEALDGEPSITDTHPVPMVESVGPLGTTIAGPDPAAFQAWENRRNGGDGR